MYKLVEGIPKPENLPTKRNSGMKYPLADMKVGDSFVVPYSEMAEGDTPEKFRNRIYQSARNYALRDRNGPDAVKKEFTAALMSEDDTDVAKRWVAGDVIVWRDQ